MRSSGRQHDVIPLISPPFEGLRTGDEAVDEKGRQVAILARIGSYRCGVGKALDPIRGGIHLTSSDHLEF
jgi:hypothetical protein